MRHKAFGDNVKMNPGKARTCMTCGVTGLIVSAINIFIPGKVRRRTFMIGVMRGLTSYNHVEHIGLGSTPIRV